MRAPAPLPLPPRGWIHLVVASKRKQEEIFDGLGSTRRAATQQIERAPPVLAGGGGRRGRREGGGCTSMLASGALLSRLRWYCTCRCRTSCLRRGVALPPLAAAAPSAQQAESRSAATANSTARHRREDPDARAAAMGRHGPSELTRAQSSSRVLCSGRRSRERS
jgi:hypothetical protein